MKKLMIVIIIGIIGYFAFNKGQHSQNQIASIKDIKENPGAFTDSLIELDKVQVLESKVLLNYCSLTVKDHSEEKLTVLTHKPYNVGETISKLTGRYILVFKNENQRCELFVTEDLKPINDLVEVLKQAVIN